jgi:mono/diheme cytochrome c family protein
VKQPWHAPESAARTKNPVKPPAGPNDAAQLNRQNCVICHGRTGASNRPAAGSLPEKPANFTDVQMRKQSANFSGTMTTGRAPMPSWQDRLSETQRWELVNYLGELTKKGPYKYLGATSRDKG